LALKESPTGYKKTARNRKVSEGSSLSDVMQCHWVRFPDISMVMPWTSSTAWPWRSFKISATTCPVKQCNIPKALHSSVRVLFKT